MKRGFRQLISETISFMETDGRYCYNISEVADGIKATWRTSKNILETLHDLLIVRIVNDGKRVKYRLIQRVEGRSGRIYSIRPSSSRTPNR